MVAMGLTIAAAGLFGRRPSPAPPPPEPESLLPSLFVTMLVLGLCFLFREYLYFLRRRQPKQSDSSFMMTAPGSAAMDESSLLLDPGRGAAALAPSP